jgi:hypothetical protein
MWFFMVIFTVNNLLSSRAYNSLHKIFSFAPLMRAFEATGSIKSSILSISSLNHLRYALVDSFFTWVIPKSLVEFFLTGMLMMKRATNLVQGSLKLMIEAGSRLL